MRRRRAPSAPADSLDAGGPRHRSRHRPHSHNLRAPARNDMLVAVARVPLRALMRRPCPQRRAGGTRLGAARRAAEAALLLPLLLLLLPARAFLALLGAVALALRAAARARRPGDSPGGSRSANVLDKFGTF